MTAGYRLVTASIKTLARALCRVDDGQLARVPQQGPLILVGNHVNFLEAPVLYTHLQPRPLAGFAKAETWDNPLLGFLADLWGAIPLRRGEMDLAALRQALQALEAGRILGVAPEGTRSGDGRLQAGYPGITVLALRSNAPLQPVVTYGGERFWPNLTRLRRTDLAIVTGRPFHLAPPAGRVTRPVRQQMIDEIMFQLAALLPPAYRGVYSDLSAATETYLHFPPGSESNLRRARDPR
jgi:1-acyl-sn-glycerol-3-phosphate acyltransferase